jgi:hypothetical protein
VGSTSGPSWARTCSRLPPGSCRSREPFRREARRSRSERRPGRRSPCSTSARSASGGAHPWTRRWLSAPRRRRTIRSWPNRTCISGFAPPRTRRATSIRSTSCRRGPSCRRPPSRRRPRRAPRACRPIPLRRPNRFRSRRCPRPQPLRSIPSRTPSQSLLWRRRPSPGRSAPARAVPDPRRLRRRAPGRASRRRPIRRSVRPAAGSRTESSSRRSGGSCPRRRCRSRSADPEPALRRTTRCASLMTRGPRPSGLTKVTRASRGGPACSRSRSRVHAREPGCAGGVRRIPLV